MLILGFGGLKGRERSWEVENRSGKGASLTSQYCLTSVLFFKTEKLKVGETPWHKGKSLGSFLLPY